MLKSLQLIQNAAASVLTGTRQRADSFTGSLLNPASNLKSFSSHSSVIRLHLILRLEPITPTEHFTLTLQVCLWFRVFQSKIWGRALSFQRLFYGTSSQLWIQGQTLSPGWKHLSDKTDSSEWISWPWTLPLLQCHRCRLLIPAHDERHVFTHHTAIHSEIHSEIHKN